VWRFEWAVDVGVVDVAVVAERNFEVEVEVPSRMSFSPPKLHPQLIFLP
jgi:hypothetical protein